MRKFDFSSESLLALWEDFVDREKRLTGPDAQFLTEKLRRHFGQRILDASLGDGIDSVQLLQKGHRVISNEVDPVFMQRAIENAENAGLELNLTSYNWLNLGFESESFGAVYCMGNSLTYLLDPDDQLTALREFHRVLIPGGSLLVDERNYQYFLDEREAILEGNFRYSGDYVYRGAKVKGWPIAIGDKEVIMRYEHEETGQRAHLRLYPFKRGELMDRIREAGFSEVEQYSNYLPGHNSEADFHQYLCYA